MDDAVMAAQHCASRIHDLARARRIRLKLVDDAGVTAFRYKADVLAVGLGGIDQPQFGGDGAHLGLFHIAQRKAQIIELRLGSGEEKIALIACRIGGGVQLRAVRAFDAADIMSGRQRLGAQFARGVQ